MAVKTNSGAGRGSVSSASKTTGTRHRSRRVALTSSKLYQPTTPIYRLATEFQDYMYLPDPAPLYALMGGMAASMMKGEVVWLMLTGSSGSGKTKLLQSLEWVPGTVTASSIKGESALLSGVRKKDRAEDATGGLLHELGEAGGCLTLLDFTTTLSQSKDTLKAIMGAFREIYDRSYKRHIGGEGGRTLTYTGKVTIMTGVTHTIDRQHEQFGDMGERFVLYRFPETDGEHEIRHSRDQTDPDAMKDHMREKVKEFFEEVGLSFADRVGRRELEPDEMAGVMKLAQLGSRARTNIPRDWHGREIVDIPTPEAPMRMHNQLAQWFIGMEYIGLEEEDIWRVLGKLAWGSVPLARARVFETIRGDPKSGVGGKTQMKTIAAVVRCGETTVKREVENLELLGLIEKSEKGWRVSEWAKERVGGL